MSKAHYAVLCYDISENRRRGRLQRKLKRYLVPVQKSVFEGPLGARQLERIVSLVEETIDLDTDTVRLYLLCGACRASTILIGTAHPLPDEREPILS